MATPANWEQFNEDMRQWQQQAQDLARTYRGLVDVAASGELGALAFIESLSEAPVGDRAALLSSLGLVGAYTRDNILGTVSQTDGVPTGAIIERGSNANGKYVKFADGTLISTSVRFQPDWGDPNYQTVPLPHDLTRIGSAFITSLVQNGRSLDVLADAVVDSTASGTIRVAFRGELDASSTGAINVTAIGEWT